MREKTTVVPIFCFHEHQHCLSCIPSVTRRHSGSLIQLSVFHFFLAFWVYFFSGVWVLVRLPLPPTPVCTMHLADSSKLSKKKSTQKQHASTPTNRFEHSKRQHGGKMQTHSPVTSLWWANGEFYGCRAEEYGGVVVSVPLSVPWTGSQSGECQGYSIVFTTRKMSVEQKVWQRCQKHNIQMIICKQTLAHAVR